MGILDMFTGRGKAKVEDAREEQLRSTARILLQRIVELENKIERYETEFRRAESRGNDPRQIRTYITTIEIEKLDIERKLEEIDRQIVIEEKRKIERIQRAA
ncbi:hypothetical protein HZA99_00955 [Candidatus Woesearchaeota archaeon]|nr:hypothetical protein [Candidatus Woesearchaeota archaeon]